MRLLHYLSFVLLPFACPATAQDGSRLDVDTVASEPLPIVRSPVTSSPSAITIGRAGQRQSREQIAQDAGIKPMARINGRIRNRVESRIRNRIDRYYDPQANATSPFEVAGDQARTAGRPRR